MSTAAAPEFWFPPCDRALVEHLRAEVPCSEVVAWILARRQIRSVAEARELIDPSPPVAEDFHDPLQLGAMSEAVARIRQAIDTAEPIVVHGDYDVDGVCSTTILVEAIEALGGDVRAFLPSRFREGYGLSIDTVERFALDGIRLIIAVDCGITAVEPVRHAAGHGIDVIVADHHEPADELPNAIICSTRPSDYPFPWLCAAAVAGKVAEALGHDGGDSRHELEALATIADCMPLNGENRAIVRRGLTALRRTSRPGLRALMSACKVHARDVAPDDIAFRLAPRINAVGRLGDADDAYEMLRAEDPAVATAAATRLHQANDERRRVERELLAAAERQIAEMPGPLRDAGGWILWGDDWHEGVAGIVASRLVEKWHRPVAVLGQHGAVLRGSARAPDGCDLHAIMQRCSDLVIRWGGHTAAAGMSVDPSQVEEFRDRFATATAEVWGEARQAGRRVRIDAVATGDELTLDLVHEIEAMAPFGEANERPLLLAPAARVEKCTTVGDGSHLRLGLAIGSTTVPAIAFGKGAMAATLASGSLVDVAFTVSINRFRGSESLQVELRELVPVANEGTSLPGDSCATGCTVECPDRVPVARVIDPVWSAQQPDSERGVSAEQLPEITLEPLLALPTTVDVRHRGRALAHIARLTSAGERVMVVCADVARRRGMVQGPLSAGRLGIESLVLASSRCDVAALARRLAPLVDRDEPDSGAIVLADYGALDAGLASTLDPGMITSTVVLDPPVTAHQRQLLASVGSPLHLVFGASELRFARTVHAAGLDTRALLGTAWRALGTAGGAASAVDIERALLEAPSGTLHPPEAVAHALLDLERRQLLTIDRTNSTIARRGG